MNATQVILPTVFMVTIIAQAVWPHRRFQVVLVGAAMSAATAAATGTLQIAALWQSMPWAVIAILVCLSILAEAVMPSNILGCLAVAACRRSRGRELGLLVIFPSLMFLLSAVVNNLTAMLIVMPIMLTVLKVLGPSDRFRNLLVSSLLVCCNLGGAASPVGDFPAVLLLGSGHMGFASYLAQAGFACIIIFMVVQAVAVSWYLLKSTQRRSRVEQQLAVETISRFYRRTNIRWRVLLPVAISFCMMVAAWIAGVAPDLVAIVGLAFILLAAGARAEGLIRNGVDVEPVAYLIGLFMMVGVVESTGVLDVLARPILSLESSPTLMICVFLVLSGVTTGMFSAGPSMAALLPLAQKMANYMTPETVYVGLALSVCAGSSLFLTAATSGPLAQCQIEAAELLSDEGDSARFGFAQFMPFGIVSFFVIQAGAIAFVLLTL